MGDDSRNDRNPHPSMELARLAHADVDDMWRLRQEAEAMAATPNARRETRQRLFPLRLPSLPRLAHRLFG